MCQKFIGHEMLWRLLSGNNNIVGCIRGGAGGNGEKMVAKMFLKISFNSWNTCLLVLMRETNQILLCADINPTC